VDSCAIAGDDATCDGEPNGGCVCGDGVINGNEVCDGGVSGSTDLGACNPLCTGFYTRKRIRRSLDNHGSDLGGIAGADAICVGDFGPGWKALLAAASRRATVTPFVGDGQLDWVIKPYTYYFNEEGLLVWRTDAVALLGASGARQQEVLAPLFDTAPVDGGGNYPWSGFDIDWTTITNQTCSNWTSVDLDQLGSFVTQNLQSGATERCDDFPYLFLLCVEQ
jgi:hypothetical protein